MEKKILCLLLLLAVCAATTGHQKKSQKGKVFHVFGGSGQSDPRAYYKPAFHAAYYDKFHGLPFYKIHFALFRHPKPGGIYNAFLRKFLRFAWLKQGFDYLRNKRKALKKLMWRLKKQGKALEKVLKKKPFRFYWKKKEAQILLNIILHTRPGPKPPRFLAQRLLWILRKRPPGFKRILKKLCYKLLSGGRFLPLHILRRCFWWRICQKLIHGNVCHLPKKPGPCRGSFRRYFYNRETRRCEQFTYGGCHGNANNFRTLAECEKRCVRRINVCRLRKARGPCTGNIWRYYYNFSKKRCEKFIYGGCHGNANNFKNKFLCEKACGPNVCELKKDRGPCGGSIWRYYYSSKDGICKKFVYGGCHGNANNFENKFKCEKACVRKNEVCLQPKKVGPCEANIERYFYNTQTQACEVFYYGGCHGNDNNFEDKSACERTCGVCSVPKDPGPCKAHIERYYYNSETQACEKFIYGGCDGNANNFASPVDCERACLF